MVQYIESERSALKGGHKLHTVVFLPGGAGEAGAAAAAVPTAVLCWHHGVAEHVGRYKDIFTRFADAGIAVYGGDMVGHGKSEGHRAFMSSYIEATDEFEAFCKFSAQDVRSRYAGAAAPPPPMFIGGHSLGGLIAALTCYRDQSVWAGMMLCSPALDVEMTLLLRFQAAIGDVLAMLVPKARIVPAVDPKDMNPDPELVKYYMADPLNTVGNLPARTANEALKGMKWLRKHWPEFKLPVYVHHGDGDKCTSAPASQAFVAAVGSSDKVLHLVPGGFHEVMLSPGVADQLIGEMLTWINNHAAGAAAPAAAAAGGSGPGPAAPAGDAAARM